MGWCAGLGISGYIILGNGWLMKHAAAADDGLADLPSLQRLGAHLFVSAERRQQWQAAVALAWSQQHLPTPAAVAQTLLSTQAYGGAEENWQVLARHDAAAAVGFIEACAQRVLPEGIRWSVAQPEEVLDVDTLFMEANQQLRVFGQQFYHLRLGDDVVVPVLVGDAVGFTALLRRLRLGYGCFDAGPTAVHHQGYGIKQVIFWVLYVLLVLWGVYHLMVWLFNWLWHWFD